VRSQSSLPERLSIFLGAFGDPGHAFPVLALGTRLAERGHAVTIETWKRWRQDVEAAGIRFVAAPEYPVFPTRERPLKPYEAVVEATPVTLRAVQKLRPDVVVHDILTLAPALAAELEGIPAATLIPHPHPHTAPGLAPYAIGARPPRTGVGRAVWRAMARAIERGLRQGRDELNDTRRRLGLPPIDRFHGGISERLVLIGTFPQLEYPRVWKPHEQIVGPLIWEPPAEDVEPPPGEEPLVLLAPSTAQDPEGTLLRAAVRGLAAERVRLLAATNRRPLTEPLSVAANTRLTEWVSYGRTMPRCALVICHAGHGTLARALASGAPVLTVPHSGDMAENAARADWAGVGVRLPWRLLTPTTLRLAVRRALAEPGRGARARELAEWYDANDPATRAAELVEELAASQPSSEPPASTERT
jgi:UDP:flavonoid glycosyltransferase YjiC (YdhE family)